MLAPNVVWRGVARLLLGKTLCCTSKRLCAMAMMRYLLASFRIPESNKVYFTDTPC